MLHYTLSVLCLTLKIKVNLYFFVISGNRVNIKWRRRNSRRKAALECIECLVQHEPRSGDFYSHTVRRNGQNAVAHAEIEFERPQRLGIGFSSFNSTFLNVLQYQCFTDVVDFHRLHSFRVCCWETIKTQGLGSLCTFAPVRSGKMMLYKPFVMNFSSNCRIF